MEEQRRALRDDRRGDVHDAATTLGAHDGNDGAGAVPDALDVDRHHAVPLGLRDLVERPRLERGEHGGVVHEHVDPAEAPDGRVHHGAHRAGVAHVGPHAERSPGRVEIDCLSSSHPRCAGGLCQQRTRGCRIVDAALRQQRERPRLKRIAGKKGNRFAERDMAARLASAHRIVVHAWKIIVDERIGVDQLDRSGGGVDVARIGADRFSRGIGEKRADTFAAAQHRIAHRIAESGGHRHCVARELGREHVFDPLLTLTRPHGERHAAIHRRPRPA